MVSSLDRSIIVEMLLATTLLYVVVRFVLKLVLGVTEALELPKVLKAFLAIITPNLLKEMQQHHNQQQRFDCLTQSHTFLLRPSQQYLS